VANGPIADRCGGRSATEPRCRPKVSLPKGDAVKRVLRILVDQRAVTVVEYAVMLGLIALLLLGSVAMLGEKGNGLWTSIQANLNESTALK